MCHGDQRKRRWRTHAGWFALPFGFLLLWLGAADGPALSVNQTPAGSPPASPIASPSPVLTLALATPDATTNASPEGDAPSGALGRTDTGGERSARPIRPSGGISIDGTGLRGNNIRRPTLAARSVYDPYRLLDSDQRDTLRADADRLRRAGLPTLVYIRISEADDQQAAAFADRLLNEWSVESAPGANDGLVMLISMGVTTRRSGEVTIRTGPRALPEGGLDAARLASIAEERIEPRLQRGQIYTGALAGLRGMVYTIAYFPAPQPPPTERERRVAEILTWLAPVTNALALIGIVGWAFRWPRPLGGRLGWIVPTAVLVCCLVLAVLAVYSRSRLGVAVVLLLAVTLAFAALFRHYAGRKRRPSTGRTLLVGPWQRRGFSSGPDTPISAVASPPHVSGSNKRGRGPRMARSYDG
ncbi:MAG: TPM domain-containing protein [Chloroflexota bacterium]|nr:TPM domain-containing protein [Chloroflexota bacterium]